MAGDEGASESAVAADADEDELPMPPRLPPFTAPYQLPLRSRYGGVAVAARDALRLMEAEATAKKAAAQQRRYRADPVLPV